jgi:drug/metabolite transporter (DMT)-like permease
MHFDDTARHRRTGIALISLTTLFFASLDAVAKWLMQELPVQQVVWMRFASHVLVTALLLGPIYGRELVRVGNWRLQALRGALLGVMTLMNFWALQYLQLAETGAIQFSVPLLIALFSAWWLGERLSARRWLAIAAGLAGVLMILRPWTGSFHPALLLCIGQVVLYALFNMLTRHMAASESPAALQWLSALGATVLLAPTGIAHWETPQGPGTWLLIAATGLLGGLGHFLVAQAHRYASAATLGPYLYQQILYMTLLGWLVFAQVPDGLVIAGAAVVVASGLYLWWAEGRGR